MRLTNNTKWAGLVGVVGLLLLTAGCGEKKAPVGHLSGTIKLAGTAFSTGMVVVSNETQHVHMTGTPDQAGHYEIKDLLLGKYRISIHPLPWNIPTGAEPPPVDRSPKIPGKYNSEETSGLEVEIVEGPNQLDISMK